MEITSKNYPITITDERPESSYHIPVVVRDCVAFGDADIVDEVGAEYGEGHVNHSVWTGKQAKYDIARREYADNAEIFNWIVKGTGLKTHAEYLAEVEEAIKQTAWMFQN